VARDDSVSDTPESGSGRWVWHVGGNHSRMYVARVEPIFLTCFLLGLVIALVAEYAASAQLFYALHRAPTSEYGSTRGLPPRVAANRDLEGGIAEAFQHVAEIACYDEAGLSASAVPLWKMGTLVVDNAPARGVGAPLPSLACAAPQGGRTIYIVDCETSSCMSADVVARTCTGLSCAPFVNCCGVELEGNRRWLFAAGGFKDGGTNRANLDVYEVAADRWLPGPDLPEALCYHSLTILPPAPAEIVEAHRVRVKRIADARARSKPAIVSARISSDRAITTESPVDDERPIAVLAGGESEEVAAVRAWWRKDAPADCMDNIAVARCHLLLWSDAHRSGRWIPLPPMPRPRQSHSAVIFDGRLVVAGGSEIAFGSLLGIDIPPPIAAVDGLALSDIWDCWLGLAPSSNMGGSSPWISMPSLPRICPHTPISVRARKSGPRPPESGTASAELEADRWRCTLRGFARDVLLCESHGRLLAICSEPWRHPADLSEGVARLWMLPCGCRPAIITLPAASGIARVWEPTEPRKLTCHIECLGSIVSLPLA
jgi:hypothetical protein